MEPDVAGSLSELERKLKDLEHELESVGRGNQPAAPEAAPHVPAWHRPGGYDPPPVETHIPAAWPAAGNGAEPAYGSPPPPAYAPPPAAYPPPPPPAYAPSHVAHAAPPTPAPGVHGQLDELLRLREQLTETTDALLAEVSRVIAVLGADAVAPAPPAPAAPPPPPQDPATTVLSGRVTVTAAPFADIAILGAFEQALGRTAGVGEVYVRALDSGRATIDVELTGAVALALELRRASPVGFRVLDVGPGRLELALDLAA